METILYFLGALGNVTTFLVFASPIMTFWRIVKNKSTEDFDPSPYVVKLLNCLLWVYYGVAKPSEFLAATVNGAGAVLEVIYVALFLLYAPPAIKTKTAIMAVILDVGCMGGLVAVTQLAMNEHLRIEVIGVGCALLSIGSYASPLGAMKTVVSTKSVEYMPFFLSFTLFINGGVWTSYAIIDRDIFIGIPNGVGFILGTIQLILYVIYMDSRGFKNWGKATEEGCKERLINPADDRNEDGAHLT